VDILDALQLRAVVAVLKPDREAWIRYICRWYSREFNTPLDRVWDLPLEFVVTNYFEAACEAMDDEQRHEYLNELVLTDEERVKLRGEEAKDAEGDEEFLNKLSEAAKAGATKGPPKERKKGFMRKAIQDAAREAAVKEYGSAPVNEATPPAAPTEQPGFSVDFGGNLLEEMGSLDPLAPHPPKKVI
jgi:succinate dehydrogenase flavin-adding protein (antitoxin of CptAB toxin-antitoxin module)